MSLSHNARGFVSCLQSCLDQLTQQLQCDAESIFSIVFGIEGRAAMTHADVSVQRRQTNRKTN